MRDRMLDRTGRCRSCGTRIYSVRELNAAEGQAWRCYRCFDAARLPGYGLVKGHPQYVPQTVTDSSALDAQLSVARRVSERDGSRNEGDARC